MVFKMTRVKSERVDRCVHSDTVTKLGIELRINPARRRASQILRESIEALTRKNTKP